MNLNSLLLIGLLSLSIQAQGQSYDLSKKQPGSVVTNTNDSLVGEVVLGNNWQSVTFMQDRSMRQLYARDLKKVILEDGYSIIKYRSLQVKEKGDFFLFKELTEGSLQLLIYDGNQSDDENPYYVQDEDFALKIPSHDKSIFNIFGKFKKEMRDYAFQMAFDLTLERDLILLFDYYNKTYAIEES